MKLFFLAACSLGVSVIHAQISMGSPQPPDVLVRAIQKAKNHRFSGVRLVEFKKGLRMNRNTEYITREGTNTRIEYPEQSSLSGQIIVETGPVRRHYFPETNEIHVLPARSEEALVRLAKLLRAKGPRCTFSKTPGDVVAGRRTEQVVVRDPQGNVTQRLYIDGQTGIVLKRILFDEVGGRVGGFEFTQIELHPKIDSSTFLLERKGASVLNPRQVVQRLAQQRGFLPVMLPESDRARLEVATVKRINEEPVLVQNYLIRDGRLTLFQLQRIVDEERLSRVAKRRANYIYWMDRGRTFVLVGNWPPKWLREISSTVSRGTVFTGR